MVNRDIIKKEIDKIDDIYLDLIYNIIRLFKFSLNDKLSSNDQSQNLTQVYSFYDALAFDMSGYKFNREEANER